MAINLTDISINVEHIIDNLNPIANCTIAINWYLKSPLHRGYYGDGPTNLEWLEMALPKEYQTKAIREDPAYPQLVEIVQTRIQEKYDHEEPIDNMRWYKQADWAIASVCLADEVIQNVTLSDLKAVEKTNCSAPAAFIGDLQGQNITYRGASDLEYYKPVNTEPELMFWRALLNSTRPGIRDETVMTWYRNVFLTGDTSKPTELLRFWYDRCSDDLCKYSGFTGNPDIGGIGVMIAYLLEASLVTFLWVHHLIFKYHPVRRYLRTRIRNLSPSSQSQVNVLRQGLARVISEASDEFLNSAMYFLLTICIAALIDIKERSLYNRYLANTIVIAMFFSLVVLVLLADRNLLLRKRIALGLCLGVSANVFIITQSLINSERFKEDTDSACLKQQLDIERGISQGAFDIVPYFMFGIILLFAFTLLWSIWYTPKVNFDREKRFPRYHALVEFVEALYKKTYPLIGLLVLFGVWLHIYLLIELRRIMQKLAGDSWSEAEWGFGQVTAALMWLPVLFSPTAETLFLCIAYLKTVSRKGQQTPQSDVDMNAEPKDSGSVVVNPLNDSQV